MILYTDKNENFECDVAVKGADLDNAFARIIVEGDGYSIMFDGNIKDGKCEVPIKKLKGLLKENTKGNMHLEVVVDDTYFKPWKEDFTVEEHTSVKVKVKEQVKSSGKPILEVKVKTPTKSKENTQKQSVPAAHLLLICERFGINKKTLAERKSDFKQIVKEYFKSNPEDPKNSKKYIQEAVSALK